MATPSFAEVVKIINCRRELILAYILCAFSSVILILRKSLSHWPFVQPYILPMWNTVVATTNSFVVTYNTNLSHDVRYLNSSRSCSLPIIGEQFLVVCICIKNQNQADFYCLLLMMKNTCTTMIDRLLKWWMMDILDLKLNTILHKTWKYNRS